MEKGKDYDQIFSPTPGIAIARIITSITAANDLELHSSEQWWLLGEFEGRWETHCQDGDGE